MHANQFSYDSAADSEIDDYRESPEFAEFAEYVTLELLNGRDWKNLSSELLLFDLEYLGGGYQMALEWVCEDLTEDQLKEWLNDN